MGPDPQRPNLVARLRGAAEGPVLGLLSHVDTVGANPAGWRHSPWSGALDDGYVWGRGALDMKSQTAAEAVAVCSLAREGWRPARGDVLVISVSDEEVDGTGAEWLTTERPDLCRCDYLVDEGAGESFARRRRALLRGFGRREGRLSLHDHHRRRRRPRVAADGRRQRAAEARPAAGCARRAPPRLGRDPARASSCSPSSGWTATRRPRSPRSRRERPDFAPDVEAMLRVTLAPTMVDASDADERHPRARAPARRLPRPAGHRASRPCSSASRRCSGRAATGWSSPSAWSATPPPRAPRCSTRCRAGSTAPSRARAACRRSRSATRTRARSAPPSPSAWHTASSPTGT